MIETLLDRINRLEANMKETVNSVVQSAISASKVRLEARITASTIQLETQIESIRIEMNAGFMALRDEDRRCRR